MKQSKAYRPENLHYLKMLARQYPNVQAASTEIINLQAILNLPKGTEHFISDVHGEYEAFLHILNSASGVVREKLDDLFGTSLSPGPSGTQLATLIYYPKEKLEEISQTVDDLREWYRITFHRLIEVCRLVSSKYTRSKVRKAMPPEYAYIIDEMLHTHYEDNDKRDYYENIISTIIDIDRAAQLPGAAVRAHQAPGGGPPPPGGGHLRPGAPGGHHPGLPDGLPQRGHPVGQPRHSVDGGGLRLPHPGGHSAGQLPALQQPGGHRDGLRHLPAAPVGVCQRGL